MEPQVYRYIDLAHQRRRLRSALARQPEFAAAPLPRSWSTALVTAARQHLRGEHPSVDVRRRFGIVRALSGRYTDALELFDADPDPIMADYLTGAFVHGRRYHVRAALECLERARRAATGQRRLDVLLSLGRLHRTRRAFDDAIDVLTEVRDDESDDHRRAVASLALSGVFERRGDLDRAREHVTESGRLAVRLHDTTGYLNAREATALILRRERRLERARAEIEAVARAFTKAFDRIRLGRALVTLSVTLADVGNAERAAACAEHAIALLRAFGPFDYLPSAQAAYQYATGRPASDVLPISYDRLAERVGVGQNLVPDDELVRFLRVSGLFDVDDLRREFSLAPRPSGEQLHALIEADCIRRVGRHGAHALAADLIGAGVPN